MSASIGGIDLVLDAPKETFDLRLILDVVAPFWPEAVYQDANEERILPLTSGIPAVAGQTMGEFFVYQNQASAESWGREGWTASNANRMLHFLVKESPDRTDAIQITLVIDELTATTADLYSTLHKAVLRPRRSNIEDELRAAGCTLTRAQFDELIEKVRQGLYPGWTQDELACHPHDAQQFCDIVRVKAGATLPDDVIMRELLNLRKRAWLVGQP